MIPEEIIINAKMLLQRLFKKHQEGDSKVDYEPWLSLAENDEEREDIIDMCDETSFYYEERKRKKQLKLTAYKYLEQRALELYKEENPNASDEDCEQYLGEVRSGLDDVIAKSADAFLKEVTLLDDGDEERTEQELSNMDEYMKRSCEQRKP